MRASSLTPGAASISADPVIWLAVALFTPGTARSADFTCASQCSHIIPLIFTVFMFFSFSAIIFCVLTALFCEPKRARRSAFDTTHTLDILMAAAAIIGLRVIPSGESAPAASGIAAAL